MRHPTSCVAGPGLGFLGQRRAIAQDVHRCNEAIPAPGNRLNEEGILGRIAEGIAQLIDRGIQAVVVIDKCIFRPEPLPQLFARHQVAGPLDEMQKDFKRLALQARALLALFAQFAGFAVQFVQAEAKCGLWIGLPRHYSRLSSKFLSHSR